MPEGGRGHGHVFMIRGGQVQPEIDIFPVLRQQQRILFEVLVLQAVFNFGEVVGEVDLHLERVVADGDLDELGRGSRGGVLLRGQLGRASCRERV